MPEPRDTATQLANAAIERLEQQGLIDRDEATGAAILNGAGMTTLLDAVTLWNIHTQGDQAPEPWQLSHDTGVAFQQAMHLALFPDADPATAADAKRRTVQALRRAARKWKQ